MIRTVPSVTMEVRARAAPLPPPRRRAAMARPRAGVARRAPPLPAPPARMAYSYRRRRRAPRLRNAPTTSARGVCVSRAGRHGLWRDLVGADAAAYLQTKSVPCEWLDARDVLVVVSESEGLGEKGSAATGGVRPLWEETTRRMSGWWDAASERNGFGEIDYAEASPILVVTGFVAVTELGRADDAQALGLRLLGDHLRQAHGREPRDDVEEHRRRVHGRPAPRARGLPDRIAQVRRGDGARVLWRAGPPPERDAAVHRREHPRVRAQHLQPDVPGHGDRGRCATLSETDTLMVEEAERSGPSSLWDAATTPDGQTIPIKGITSIDKVALVNLEGASLIGVPGVAQKFMVAMSDAGINVLLVTQASSDHTLCVAVPEDQGEKALEAVRSAFELELTRSTVGNVSLLRGMAIVAIIGEGMAFRMGVSATFMRALSNAKANVRAIAQGSSERQIAVVMAAEQASRAMRSVHQAFTLSETIVSVAVVGGSGASARSSSASSRSSVWRRSSATCRSPSRSSRRRRRARWCATVR